MFFHKDLETRVLGIVENMSWFTPEELPDNKYYIFGKGGAKALSEKYDIPILAEIPLCKASGNVLTKASPPPTTNTRPELPLKNWQPK